MSQQLVIEFIYNTLLFLGSQPPWDKNEMRKKVRRMQLTPPFFWVRENDDAETQLFVLSNIQNENAMTISFRYIFSTKKLGLTWKTCK